MQTSEHYSNINGSARKRRMREASGKMERPISGDFRSVERQGDPNWKPFPFSVCVGAPKSLAGEMLVRPQSIPPAAVPANHAVCLGGPRRGAI
jgi:hypothetical protein